MLNVMRISVDRARLLDRIIDMRLMLNGRPVAAYAVTTEALMSSGRDFISHRVATEFCRMIFEQLDSENANQFFHK